MAADRTTIDLAGRDAIVTGGSSGIGAQIARTLAACGARVAAVGRNRERLQAVVDGIAGAGGTAVAVAADLADPAAAERVVDEAVRGLGRVDTLINCAGVYEPADFDATSSEMLDRALHLNIRSPFLLTQAALPHLRDGGRVVFISSIVAKVGCFETSAYSASKAGLEGLARALAWELGWQGVRVNTITPGDVVTPMSAPYNTDPEEVAARVAMHPSGRQGTPDDVAAMTAFLVSDLARQVYGETIVIDGGLNLGVLLD